MTNEMLLAQQVYETLCTALDERDWNYEEHEDDLTVRFGVKSNDINMDFVIMVDAERQLISLMSMLPFKMREDKRIDGAVAACAASFNLVDGSFDYNIADGSIVFRMTAAFHQSDIGEGLFHYMIGCACGTIDEYNDRFLALDKGMIDISDFFKN